MNTPHCPICNSIAGQNSWPTDRIKGGKRVLWCPVCDFGWQYPLPKKEEIQKDFKHSIYMIQSESEKNKGFERRIRRLNTFLPDRGDLLDIGCGSGHFMLAAQKAGWSVKGVEPHEKAAEFCRNHYDFDVVVDVIENQQYKSESFDVITLWDVWEHVYDPIIFMDRCLEMLAPSGILALAVPNASGWPARLFKGSWRYVMFVHLNYFKMSFVHRIMKDRHMYCIHADHTIKIQSLLQGVLSLLPLKYNIEEILRLGRKGSIETDRVNQPLSKQKHNSRSGLRNDFLHKIRQLALGFNLIQFSFPIGDMVDLYFQK